MSQYGSRWIMATLLNLFLLQPIYRCIMISDFMPNDILVYFTYNLTMMLILHKLTLHIPY